MISTRAGSILVLYIVMFLNFFPFYSLAEEISYKNLKFQKKTFVIQEGQELPATFKFKKDQFVFTMQRDLSVTFTKAR